jgi:hypothetical protein
MLAVCFFPNRPTMSRGPTPGRDLGEIAGLPTSRRIVVRFHARHDAGTADPGLDRDPTRPCARRVHCGVQRVPV